MIPKCFLREHLDDVMGGGGLGGETRNWILAMLSWRYLLGMRTYPVDRLSSGWR